MGPSASSRRLAAPVLLERREELADLPDPAHGDRERDQNEARERDGERDQPQERPAHAAASPCATRGTSSEPSTNPATASAQLRFPAVATSSFSQGTR